MKIDFVCSLFSIHNTVFFYFAALSIAPMLDGFVYLHVHQEFSRVISLNFQFNFLLLCCVLVEFFHYTVYVYVCGCAWIFVKKKFTARVSN